MKKVFSTLAVACSLFATTSVFAQDAATTKGDLLLDIGIGLIGNEYNYNSNYTYNNEKKYQLPTFSVALQKAFWDDITIGGQISFNSGGSKYDDYSNPGNGYYQTNVKYTQFNSYFTARGEYHFNRLIGLDPKFDLYAGALVGFVITNQVSRYDEGSNAPGSAWGPVTHKSRSVGADPVIGPFGGFRYYFANNFGVYGEVGWAITVVRGGLVWRL